MQTKSFTGTSRSLGVQKCFCKLLLPYRALKNGLGQAMLASHWSGTRNIKQTSHMAHEAQPELLNGLLQLINEHGTDGFA